MTPKLRNKVPVGWLQSSRPRWFVIPLLGVLAATRGASAQDPTVRNGFSIKALTCGPGEHRWPSVNGLGDVVWSEREPSLGDAWQVVLYRPTGTCVDRPCDPGCTQRLTATAFRNNERPTIDDARSVLFFRDGSGSGPGFEVVRRDPGGGESVVEFSSRNQATGAQRSAGRDFGIAANGASISYYDFRDPLGGTNVRRLSVSGIGQLQNIGGGTLDFMGSDAPDINVSRHVVYVSAGQLVWGHIAQGTSILQPLGKIATGATFPRISDTSDFDLVQRRPPEVVFLRNDRAESSRWGVITRRGTHLSTQDPAAWVDISDEGPSGGPEWRTVYELSTGAGTSQVYLATAPVRGPSQAWEQGQAPWGSQCYGRRLGSCPGKAIANVGCALTSLSMALDAALRDFPSLWDLHDPGTLNAYMRDRSMSGVAELYSRDSGVIWPNVVKSIDSDHRGTLEAGGCAELRFELEGRQWVGPFAESSAAMERLRALLGASPSVTATSRGGYPVIVGVKMRPVSTDPEIWNFSSSPFVPGHFVLATGIAEDGRVEILDPASSACKKRYLDEFFTPNCGRSTYAAGFQIVGRVIDPLPERRVTLTASGASLLVTDAQGRRTGYVPEEGQVVEEIPDSAFSMTGIEDTDSGALDSYTAIVELPEPSGSYALELHPFSSASHSLVVSPVDSAGISLPDKVVREPGLYGDAFVLDASASSVGVRPVLGELDEVPPVVSIELSPPPNQEGWNNTPVTAIVRASDLGTGVLEVAYAIDGGPEHVEAGNSVAIPIETAGSHSIRFAAIDVAGNRSPWQEQEVSIDFQPPVTHLSVEQQSTDIQFIFFTSDDQTLSDWMGHEINVDGTGWVPSGDIFFLPNTGFRELGYRAVDWAGNRELDRLFVSQGTSGTWLPASSMACAHWRGSASPLESGKVLLASGATTQNAFCSSEVFDPASNSWTPTGPMTTRRIAHTSAVLASGEVLVTGGMTGPYVAGSHPPLADAEIYDPNTNSWRAIAPMNTARYGGHAVVALPDGRALVLGGSVDGEYFITPTTAAEIYDPASDRWTPTAPLPSERIGFNATVLPDGRVLVVGGESNFSVGNRSVDIYDPASEIWQAGPELETSRVDASLTVLSDDKLLLAGGYELFIDSNGYSNWRVAPTTVIFDPETMTFAPGAPMINARSGHRAARLGDGRVLVIGNGVQGSSILDNPALPNFAEMYDPVGNFWQFAPLTTTGGANGFAVPLPSGQVLFAGSAGVSAEIFSDGVVDQTPPVVSPSANLLLEAEGPSGAVGQWPPLTALDAVDGDVPVSCVPMSGTMFPIGSTAISCSARDQAGNMSSTAFSALVTDTTPPSFIPAPNNLEVVATDSLGAVVTYGTPSALDLVSGPTTVLCTPASDSRFAVGETVVSCSSSDEFGNVGHTTFRVVVKPPVARPLSIVRITPSRTNLWPPNNRMAPVVVSTVTSGGGSNVRCAISNVSSSQPVRGAGDRTSPDWQVLGATRVNLRAERTSDGENERSRNICGYDRMDPRIYTIAVTCTDDSYASAGATTTVTVPAKAPRE